MKGPIVIRAWMRNPAALSVSFAGARTGLFRASLLFGSIAAALALIVVPEADRHAKTAIAERAADIDQTTTGSIGSPRKPERYTIYQSILDRPDQGPCIMFPDGSQKGAC